ncbi:MAG: hypothetical protein ACTHPS_26280, partial [Streptosporangiaceae bacterium]
GGPAPPPARWGGGLAGGARGRGDAPAWACGAWGQCGAPHGPAFGSQGSGFVRLNIGTSPELIAEAVRRMVLACQGADPPAAP